MAAPPHNPAEWGVTHVPDTGGPTVTIMRGDLNRITGVSMSNSLQGDVSDIDEAGKFKPE